MVCDPTGNITVLVKSRIEKGLQLNVTRKLLELEPEAEQVGFLTDDGVRMSGGEFCGNASMCCAAYRYKNSGENSVNIKFEDCNTCVNVRVEECTSGYLCRVMMPKPESIDKVMLNISGIKREYPIASFDGISHIITEEKIPKSVAEKAIIRLCDELKTASLGIMFVSGNFTEITPLVYVKQSETLFWENSCASGTAAAGAYLASIKSGKLSADFKEPSGTLSVETDELGNIILVGKVKFIKECSIDD